MTVPRLMWRGPAREVLAWVAASERWRDAGAHLHIDPRTGQDELHWESHMDGPQDYQCQVCRDRDWGLLERVLAEHAHTGLFTERRLQILDPSSLPLG